MTSAARLMRGTRPLARGEQFEVHVPAKSSIDHTTTSLTLVFLVVIGSFLGSSIFARYASVEIASLSEKLATNVAPSIEDLASVRGSVREVELALSHLLSAGEATPDRIRELDNSLSELRSAVHQYLARPLAPGERQAHDQVQQAWLRFAEVAGAARERVLAGDFEQARRHMLGVEPAVRSLVQASLQAIDFNADYGQVLATEIGESRRRTALVAGGLTGLSVLLGMAGGLLLHRQARRRRILIDERLRLLEDRATELEQFAGRVAHDIRGPLSGASLAIELLASQEDDENVRSVVARLKRQLGHANAITSDLLQFARAGAKPDPGARTSPRDIIANIREDLEAEAAKHDIELVWEEIPWALVACSQGVYLSLLENLVRNAIKYMGRSDHRRIVVSVAEDGAAVRTEVADTGPGIPEDQLDSLFEPFFRAASSAGREGIGLGLPTVRKLAESHGGKVGVSSKEGAGSTFWFTLPRAGSLTE